MKKSIEQYELEEAIRNANDKERALSNSKYADKLIERIVIGFVTLFALGVLGFIGDILVKAIYHLPQ